MPSHYLSRARVFAVVAATLTALGTLGGLATPAAAHAHFVSADPAAGATLTEPPSHVRLTFDEPITQAHLAVVGPDGARWDDGVPAAADRTVTQHLHPLGPAGTYAINYRVVSADGHPVQGTISFTLAAAASASESSASQPAQSAQPAQPAQSAQPAIAESSASPSATSTSEPTSPADPLWPALIVVLAVLAAGIAIAAVIRSRRRTTRR